MNVLDQIRVLSPGPAFIGAKYAYHNGKMVPIEAAAANILCQGFQYGSGVFEGERSNEHGDIFKGPEHTRRLVNSAKMISLTLPMHVIARLEDIKQEVLEANRLKSAYIRVSAFRDCSEAGVLPGQGPAIITAVAWRWGAYYEQTGLTLQTSRWRKPDKATFPVEGKISGGYVTGSIAKLEAHEAGFGDALLLDTKGKIAEASSANIFFVDRDSGELYTPTTEGRMLSGITRQTVIDEIAPELGIKVHVTDITPSHGHLFQTLKGTIAVSEVFVTGTAAEVTRVTRIDNTEYPKHKITDNIATAYKALFNSRAYAHVPQDPEPQVIDLEAELLHLTP